MGLKITEVEDLVSHYEGILQQSDSARQVVQSWGLSAGQEEIRARRTKGQLLELLAEGMDEFPGG